MKALHKLIRSAHCRRTHQYFAIDALPLVQTAAGNRLVRILLKHYDRYLTGAIDPDERFCDYQNHVIHVTDGYWGGAPRVAHKWYDRMQRYLREERYKDAAHAAGVICHYFTDSLQPLHTQQSKLEKVLHRPIKWSINQSYQDIFRSWQQDGNRIVFQLSEGPCWLGEAMLHGARFANRKFDQLLAEYNPQGIHQPRVGLNSHLRASLSEVIGLSVTGWARILERAASDSEATRRQPLPRFTLAAAVPHAAASAPVRRWFKSVEKRAERRAISKLLNEFTNTGDVREHLSAEVDIVHRVIKVYADEKRWKREREQRLASRATVIRIDSVDMHPRESASDQPADDLQILPFPTAAAPAEPPRVATNDPLTEVPSIGQQTAHQINELGIHTVGEFIAASPSAIAFQLQAYWVTAELLADWQAEARLHCEVEDLQPWEIQLLAGSGYTNVASIRQTTPDSLHQQVSQFLMTTKGKRLLKGKLPTLGDVGRWIQAADQTQQGPQVRRSA